MIPLRKKLAYSSNQIGINLLWQAFNTVAVFYYVSVLHVSATRISVGMIVYGIVNAFLNLLVGHLSDRTNTRFGRRIPYILFSSLPFAVLFYLLFHPLVAAPNARLVYFFIVTLLFDLCFTFVALNVGALYPEMYQSAQDRSNVAAMQQIFGIVGMIVGVALSKSVGQSAGWGTMALVFGAIALVTLYVSLYGSFENPAYREQPLHFRTALRETFRNPFFVVYVLASLLIQLTTTMFVTLSSFYSNYVVMLSPLQSSLFLGLLFIVAIPFNFVWARIAVRVTTIQATIWTTILYAVISVAFLFDRGAVAVVVTGAVLGIAIAGFMVLMNILLADVIDHDARVTGKRREGMYLGMNGFIVRIGMSVQYAIMGIFFATTKFDASRTMQSRAAVLGLRMLVGGLPVILLLVACLLLLRYRKYARATSGLADTEAKGVGSSMG